MFCLPNNLFGRAFEMRRQQSSPNNPGFWRGGAQRTVPDLRVGSADDHNRLLIPSQRRTKKPKLHSNTTKLGTPQAQVMEVVALERLVLTIDQMLSARR